MRILIVDDSSYERSKLRLFLTDLGHTVVEAGDGQNALVQLFEDGVLDASFGAIISDMRMPPGTSGLWLLQYLNHERVHLPFLLHSSESKAREGGHDFDLTIIPSVFDFAEFHVKSDDFKYVEEFLGRLR